MIGKRVQFHQETWHELQVLAGESMKSFQELADEAFNDLLKKHGRPASLKEALRRRKRCGHTARPQSQPPAKQKKALISTKAALAGRLFTDGNWRPLEI